MSTRSTSVRIGCGAGFAGDRIDAAEDLANGGALDFLFFECLAERTLALAQLARRSNPAGGFNPLLERRMRAVLPACRKHGTRIITNMGAANPEGAGELVAAVARDLGLAGLRIAIVTGDDVLTLVSADMIASKWGFTRDHVDAYSVESHKRSARSWAAANTRSSSSSGCGRQVGSRRRRRQGMHAHARTHTACRALVRAVV